jgi:hypothetical protein
MARSDGFFVERTGDDGSLVTSGQRLQLWHSTR